MDFDAAIAAHSVAEEYAHIARQRCACGGSLRFVKQALLRKEERYFDLDQMPALRGEKGVPVRY